MTGVATTTKREANKNYQTALLLLASSTVGVGYMTYPRLCANIGVGNLLLVFSCCGLLSLFYTSLILRVYLIRKADSYPELARRVLGEGHYFAMLAVLTFYLTFSMIPQLTMMAHLCRKFAFGRFESVARVNWLPNAIIVAVSTLLSFVDLRRIRTLSYVGNFFSLYLGLILILQAMHQVLTRGVPGQFRLFAFNREILSAFATCLFSFTNQIAFVPIIKVLRNDTDYLHFATVLRSQYLGFLLYSNIGVSGYLLTGAAAPAFIVHKAGTPSRLESLFQYGCMGLLGSLSVTFCLKVYALRQIWMCMYDDLTRGTAPRKDVRRAAKVLISLVSGAAAVLISVKVRNDIMEFISLACSVLCPYIIFICPTLMALRLRNELNLTARRALFLQTMASVWTGVLLCAIGKTVHEKVLVPFLARPITL